MDTRDRMWRIHAGAQILTLFSFRSFLDCLRIKDSYVHTAISLRRRPSQRCASYTKANPSEDSSCMMNLTGTSIRSILSRALSTAYSLPIIGSSTGGGAPACACHGRESTALLSGLIFGRSSTRSRVMDSRANSDVPAPRNAETVPTRTSIAILYETPSVQRFGTSAQ